MKLYRKTHLTEEQFKYKKDLKPLKNTRYNKAFRELDYIFTNQNVKIPGGTAKAMKRALAVWCPFVLFADSLQFTGRAILKIFMRNRKESREAFKAAFKSLTIAVRILKIGYSFIEDPCRYLRTKNRWVSTINCNLKSDLNRKLNNCVAKGMSPKMGFDKVISSLIKETVNDHGVQRLLLELKDTALSSIPKEMEVENLVASQYCDLFSILFSHCIGHSIQIDANDKKFKSIIENIIAIRRPELKLNILSTFLLTKKYKPELYTVWSNTKLNHPARQEVVYFLGLLNTEDSDLLNQLLAVSKSRYFKDNVCVTDFNALMYQIYTSKADSATKDQILKLTLSSFNDAKVQGDEEPPVLNATQLGTKIHKLEKKVTFLKSVGSKKTTAISETKKWIVDNESNKASKVDLGEKKLLLKESEKSLKEIKQKISKLENSIKDLKAENEKVKKQESEAQSEKLKKLAENQPKLTSKEIQKKINDLTKKIKSNQSLLNNKLKKFQEKEDIKTESNESSKINSAQQSTTQLQNNIDMLKKSIQSFEIEKDNLTTELESMMTPEEIRKRLDAIENSIQRLQTLIQKNSTAPSKNAEKFKTAQEMWKNEIHELEKERSRLSLLKSTDVNKNLPESLSQEENPSQIQEESTENSKQNESGPIAFEISCRQLSTLLTIPDTKLLKSILKETGEDKKYHSLSDKKMIEDLFNKIFNFSSKIENLHEKLLTLRIPGAVVHYHMRLKEYTGNEKNALLKAHTEVVENYLNGTLLDLQHDEKNSSHLQNIHKHDAQLLMKWKSVPATQKASDLLPNIANKYAGYTVMQAIDPSDILMIGNDTHSCLILDGRINKIRGIIEYLRDGKTHTYLIKNEEGTIIKEAQLRLLWDSKNQCPTLFLDKVSNKESEELRKVIEQYALNVATQLGLPLVSKEPLLIGKKSDQKYCGEVVAFKGPVSFDYLDYYLGVRKAPYNLPNLIQVN